MNSSRKDLRVAAFSLWFLGVALGLFRLTVFSLSSDSPAATALGTSTQGTPGFVASQGYTLALVVHPMCPCTKATVLELERLLTKVETRPALRALVYSPEGHSEEQREEWHNSSVYKSLARIPDLQVVKDPEGELAALHGASVSGHALLFEPSGRLRFSGGITAMRGHEGENRNADRLAEALSRSSTELRTTPAFGCSLISPDREELSCTP